MGSKDVLYDVSAADRLAMPAAYAAEARYVGYQDDDAHRPYAHHFSAEVDPIQAHARDALDAGQVAPSAAYEIGEVVDHLSRPGHGSFETGWTLTDRGTLVVACLTNMPGASAAMWDWWFGWHGNESARYKLWHPSAHVFSAVGEDRRSDRSLTDRQRYIGNVSYVDEYIGGRMEKLAIRFFDPARLGFEDTPGTTHICGRAGASEAPVASGFMPASSP